MYDLAGDGAVSKIELATMLRSLMGTYSLFEMGAEHLEEGDQVHVVTLLLHCCYTVVTLLLHCCHTVVTLLLLCRCAVLLCKCVLGFPGAG
jgi:hypothetical protein